MNRNILRNRNYFVKRCNFTSTKNFPSHNPYPIRTHVSVNMAVELKIARRNIKHFSKPSSVKKTLVDAGPLIALFDKDDQYHKQMVNFFKNHHHHYISTWPVLTEVTHLLDFHPQVPIDFLSWVNEGGLTLFELNFEHLHDLIHFSKKYHDIPMDLADASLVIASQELEIDQILTLDSDFHIYRTKAKKSLKNIFHR